MKTNFSNQQLQQILDLYNQDLGSRKIAQIMNVNRSTIQRTYKQLGLDSHNKKTPRFAHKVTQKMCNICKIDKNIIEFRKRWNDKTQRLSFECYCIKCEKEYNNKRQSTEEYKKKNKKYYLLNKKQIRLRSNAYEKKRIEKDISFKLRKNISTKIRQALKKNNSVKISSIINYLPYSFEELKNHLEKQFEPWMTWDNQGIYEINLWDDNNSKTWKWQIDHIIPQSDLPYNSIKDENFIKCWDLNNLRPLSAKQNLLEGANRIRHK